MAIKIVENKKFTLGIVPNADNTTIPGALLRRSKAFKKGNNKDKKSNYFLVELEDDTVDFGELERGRVVFPIMELTDSKRFRKLYAMLQEKLGENPEEWVSKSPLVNMDIPVTGAVYKIPAPHTLPNKQKYANISFFVNKSENQSEDAIQQTYDYIKKNMEDQGIKFDAPKPSITVNPVKEDEKEEEEGSAFE